MELDGMRRAYRLSSLNKSDLPTDPMTLFETWLERALDTKIVEPNAMALATVGTDGQPSVRYVLLKGSDPGGFTFFSNYGSRKGVDLAAQPKAALAFWWPSLERQVRVEGTVQKLPAAESDRYFHSRPYGSQIGSAASPQSQPIESREELARLVNDMRQSYPEGETVPRPPQWGGYRLRPERMEFWQGRDDRLHDRFEYQLEAGGWRLRRLAP